MDSVTLRDKGKGTAPTTAMLLPAITPLSFGNIKESDIRYYSLIFVWCFGVVESIVSTTLLWTAVDGLEEKEWVYALAIVASIGAIAKWLFGYVLLAMRNVNICDRYQWWVGDWNLRKTLNLAQERTDLQLLYEGRQWTELVEIIIFKMGSVWSACTALFVEFLKYPLCPFCSHFVIVLFTDLVSREQEFLFFGCGVTVCSK